MRISRVEVEENPKEQARTFGAKARVYHVVFALGAVVGLPAAAEAQSVKIVGIGASTCAQFLKVIEGRSGAEREYFSWAQGYMSGLLIRAPAGKDEDLDLAPPAFPLLKQADFLRTQCSRNTGADFSDAVNTLYRTLRAPPS